MFVRERDADDDVRVQRPQHALEGGDDNVLTRRRGGADLVLARIPSQSATTTRGSWFQDGGNAHHHVGLEDGGGSAPMSGRRRWVVRATPRLLPLPDETVLRLFVTLADQLTWALEVSSQRRGRGATGHRDTPGVARGQVCRTRTAELQCQFPVVVRAHHLVGVRPRSLHGATR